MTQSPAPVKKRKFTNKPAVGLPKGILYKPAIGALKPRLKRFNVNISKEGMESIKPPFVVLANHCSKQDWIFVGEAMMPEMLNVVITTYYFAQPKLRALLKCAGAIPKNQFSPDVSAAKNMLSVASRGGNIMLFPEGRTTPSGESETFERPVVKLLRHLKMPVVGIHMDGAYLTMPKWNDKPRKGRVDMHIFPLFLAEELPELTDDEIFDRITEKLYTDEFKWQKENRVRFEGADCAEGLENVLFMCPKCGSEFTTQTSGDTIKCSHCGSGARLNEYYDLIPLDENCVVPENISEWYKWQVAEQTRMAEENQELELRDHAVLKQTKSSRSWIEPVGEGEALLNREGFHFDGVRNGEPYSLFIPLSMLPAVAFGPKVSFELYYKGEFFSFHPDNLRATQKWSMLAEVLHNIYCE